jgi:hypothetical protein
MVDRLCHFSMGRIRTSVNVPLKIEEKRIRGSVLRLEFCGISFGRKTWYQTLLAVHFVVVCVCLSAEIQMSE